MNLLLDEQLDTPALVVTQAMNAMAPRHGLTFRALRAEKRGLDDEDIPGYCKQKGVTALVTANVKDFGAKLPLYRALLEAGISVVVVRPGGRLALTPERRLGILAIHCRWVAKRLQAAEAPTLLRLTPTNARERTLDELREEIEGKKPGLP